MAFFWAPSVMQSRTHFVVNLLFPKTDSVTVTYQSGTSTKSITLTSTDGTNWSGYEPVITPDWMDAQDTQFMELDTIPEKGGYIGTLAVYHLLTQTIDIQFAASRDGKTWWRPDRRACVPLTPLGDNEFNGTISDLKINGGTLPWSFTFRACADCGDHGDVASSGDGHRKACRGSRS